MKITPTTISLGIAALSILVGVAFSGSTFEAALSPQPAVRFFTGVGISTLIIGLGGAAGCIPGAIKLLSSGKSDGDKVRKSFQELLVYSVSFVLGGFLILSLTLFQ